MVPAVAQNVYLLGNDHSRWSGNRSSRPQTPSVPLPAQKLWITLSHACINELLDIKFGLVHCLFYTFNFSVNKIFSVGFTDYSKNFVTKLQKVKIECNTKSIRTIEDRILPKIFVYLLQSNKFHSSINTRLYKCLKVKL